MDRCGCGDDFASIFDGGTAEGDRDRYRASGPDRATRMLLRFWVRRSPYRSYGHSNIRIDELVGERGFRPVTERRTWFWRVVLYAQD